MEHGIFLTRVIFIEIQDKIKLLLIIVTFKILLLFQPGGEERTTLTNTVKLRKSTVSCVFFFFNSVWNQIQVIYWEECAYD